VSLKGPSIYNFIEATIKFLKKLKVSGGLKAENSSMEISLKAFLVFA